MPSGITATQSRSTKPSSGEVSDLFREGLQLSVEEETQLAQGLEKGLAYFNQWNESRMELAFDSFDLSMKRALYEIIYLLHINDPKLENWKYKTYQPSNPRNHNEQEKTACLYLRDAPFGVKAIDRISSVFKEEFEDYVLETFGEPIPTPQDNSNPAIEGLYSIGSIGTVGHKNIDSDLDLQVQYNLEPSDTNPADWNDGLILEKLKRVLKGYQQKVLKQETIAKEVMPPESLKRKADRMARHKLKAAFPFLYQQLITKERNICTEIRRKNSQKLKRQLVFEIVRLMSDTSDGEELKNREELLVSRIKSIQNYVTDKFPDAEIYLFSFSRENLQKGSFGSTVESKESSGGAYELILNYETLFPGIFFTPVVPSHFLFSQDINNAPDQFARLNEQIRFGLLKGYDSVAGLINDQGPTPDLTPGYVADHSAAAYWEAFKGSSGNLPKATLNLLRFEMLLEADLNKTNIQMVKNPDCIDGLILPSRPEQEKKHHRSEFPFPIGPYLFSTDETKIPVEYNDAGQEMIFPPDRMKDFEEKHPKLKQDPWWLRYKSLKIAYGRPGLVPDVPDSAIPKISDTIDLAFALHIRISDVFTKPGNTGASLRHREQVLTDYLAEVFPNDSPQRHRLHATFVGDVKTVNEFEKDLREIFQSSVDRIHEKVSKPNAGEKNKSSDEEQIWYHYYKKSFQAPPNVIQKSILNHLQVPRGRLQIGYKAESGWFFKSLQKSQSMNRRFQSSVIDLLPDEIILVEHPHFLSGLVYCVINGYYGIFNRGRLDETKTAIEYDRQNINVGSTKDNELAFLRPDQIDRIMESILEAFPERKVSYLDCISKERAINEVMIFLNLMKFGQLSILYRDNFNTYYADQFILANFEKNTNTYIASYEKMFKSSEINLVLNRFFLSRSINPDKISLNAWVNPNSVQTSHASPQLKAKEIMLADAFRETIKAFKQPE